MKKFRLHFLMLMFATQTIALSAQSTDRPKPWFSLSIKASDPSHLPTHYTADRRVVLVTYTNISEKDDTYLVDEPEGMLDMHVLRDGAPAEESKNMRALQEERHPTKQSKYPIMGSYQAPITIKAGKSITFPLPIGDYFDMTKPGTYAITFSKETYPYDPAKSVTVWSNTIEIIVPTTNGAPQ